MYPDRIDYRPLQTCTETVRVEARPDARVIFLSVDYEINDELFSRYELTMRRLQTSTDMAAADGSAAR
jgi:hypothetical protein